jgi:hypothetical protein
MGGPDGSASRFCKSHTASIVCQDFDEASELAGFNMGVYSELGVFKKTTMGPATLLVENGYLHGNALSSVNESWITGPAVAMLSVGVSKPASQPGETFIDYYVLTSP